MATLFRWMFWLTTGLLVLTVAAFSLAYYFAARSLPDYSDNLQVNGLIEEVEIVRDHSNVPHVFATNDQDTFFALGFVHAQDRLWQMIMTRRAVQGRMSELFGSTYLQQDILMRRLDLYKLSVASADDQTPETTAALTAYAAGVNAWLAEVNEGARGRGAPEMWLFNQPIAPWQPADSIAVLKLMALRYSAQLDAELLRANVTKLIADDRRADILPDAPGSAVVAMPDYAALVPSAPETTVDYAQRINPLAPYGENGNVGASNAWAAGVSRSTTGSTLLANDPHSALTVPTQWYLARVELTSGGVIGATVPGIPVVFSGRSAALGWGITAAWVDDMDVSVEEVNTSDRTQYRDTQGWSTFRTRDSIIARADGPAETIKLLWTDNGPVLPVEQFGLRSILPPNHVATLNWTGLSDSDTSMSALIGLMSARDVIDAFEATDTMVAPAMNLVLADRNRIGMKVIGALPDRSFEHQSQGRLPTFGYIAENRWNGILPAGSGPMVYEPDSGIIGNTNNKTTDAVFPDHLSYVWGDTQRINRLRRLMQMREVHTRESFIEAQLDTVSFSARSLLPLVGADLWFTGEAAPSGTLASKRQTALQLLANWNGEMNEHRPEPLIYAAWMRSLQQRLIQDELGELASEFTHLEPLFIERVFRNIDGASAWCDVLQSAPVETCLDMASVALDDAVIWLDETYGGGVEALRWGDAHFALHEHPELGQATFLNWFTNIRQSTSGGDNTLMRGLTQGDGDTPFRNIHAAGYRGVYDFADPDSSVFIISTGQSGHPLSRHYDDLGELWRRGEYIPMSLDPTLARAAAVGITVLNPEN